MCWYRPGVFVTCPGCDRPHFHHYRFMWEGEGRSKVGYFPDQVPENEVDGNHPCTCDSPEVWYWDLHLPHQEDYARYCHRCKQQARAYHLQHGEDPPEIDRSLEHTPAVPGIAWTGHHTRFPKRHEVWSRSRGGPLPDFGAEASSDSTEREYHEAREDPHSF